MKASRDRAALARARLTGGRTDRQLIRDERRWLEVQRAVVEEGARYYDDREDDNGRSDARNDSD